MCSTHQKDQINPDSKRTAATRPARISMANLCKTAAEFAIKTPKDNDNPIPRAISKVSQLDFFCQHQDAVIFDDEAQEYIHISVEGE